MRYVAFADRSGVIRFGRRSPRGAPPIGQHRRFDSPRRAVSAAARRDHQILLVPSAPEGKSDDADLAAVVAVVKHVETRLKERAS